MWPRTLTGEGVSISGQRQRGPGRDWFPVDRTRACYFRPTRLQRPGRAHPSNIDFLDPRAAGPSARGSAVPSSPRNRAPGGWAQGPSRPPWTRRPAPALIHLSPAAATAVIIT